MSSWAAVSVPTPPMAVRAGQAAVTSGASWVFKAVTSVVRAWMRRARERSAALTACSGVAGSPVGRSLAQAVTSAGR